MYDLVIRGGTLYDGRGSESQRVDVGIQGRTVTQIGDLGEAPTARVIEAEGAWVLPGFVDLHTHYDLCLDWPELSAHCLRQGITTVVGGNCGLGDPGISALLSHAEQVRLGVNFGVLAPLGPLRSRVVPRAEGRPARGAELAQLEAEVSAALDAGALGVSWGPYHANALMDEGELARAVAVAARRGKPYCVHRRSEGTKGLEATQEAVSLARATGVRLQISHLKAAGRLSWSQFEPVLDCVEAARRDHDVAVDLYPYDASLTYLSAVIPDRLKAAGQLLDVLGSPEGWRDALAGVHRWFEERQGPELIVLLAPALEGLERGVTVAEAASTLGSLDPAETILRLIQADPAGTGGWATYRHMMAPEQVEQILDLGFAAIASDAVPEEGGDGMSQHPRVFATFARALSRVLAKGGSEQGRDLALADVVRRCTRFPAERMNLARGAIGVGEVADVLVIRELNDLASFERPDQYPAGIEHVIVAGKVACAHGELTGEGLGEVLR
jgi:N-acyl-D-amino-acid deacylase